MSAELASFTANSGSELSRDSAFSEKVQFNPDRRIDSSSLDSKPHSFDPNKRVDISESEICGQNEYEKYNPDDRISGDNPDKDTVSQSNNAGTSENRNTETTSSVSRNETGKSTEFSQNPHQETIDGKTYYYDDNGNLYRVDNVLLPNSEYQINGYKYKTDDQGRIISAEGTLHLKDREGRLPIKDSLDDIGKGDQKEGDDRGHLIGDQFDGSNGLENMIPQDADINRNDFKNFENELAKYVKDGKEVFVKVEPVYEGDSKRPSAVVVTYSIDGEESVRVFPNN